MWDIVAGEQGLHVVPRADWREHEASPACFCRPTNDEGVWAHNSVDRRELMECGGKPS